MLVLVLRRAGLTPPPISWLKGRLVAEEAAELAGGVLLLLSRLPVAGMDPGKGVFYRNLIFLGKNLGKVEDLP